MITLDRFEEDFAVLDIDGKIKNVRRNLIDKNAKEGDVLIFENEKYIVDKNATATAKKEIIDLQNSLWE